MSPDSLHALSGFCVGLLVGMTGVCGGSLMTPLLILLSLPSNHCSRHRSPLAASTKTVGTVVDAAAQDADPWLAIVGLLAIGSAPATIASLVALSFVDLGGAAAQHIVSFTLGGVLLVTALFLIAGKSVRERYADRLGDLPLNIHPAAIRVSAVDTPFGAV